jgi:hypothetical protein
MIPFILAFALAVFPTETGRNLNGDTVHLPAGFQAPASFVYVAYTRGQQAQVNSWKPFVTGVRHRFPAIGEYEIPTLPGSSKFFRAFIDGGMRNGITDPATRAATITLYIDKKPFNDALGVTDEGEIVVLLVKPDGTILWSARGAYDASKSTGLDAVLGALS